MFSKHKSFSIMYVSLELGKLMCTCLSPGTQCAFQLKDGMVYLTVVYISLPILCQCTHILINNVSKNVSFFYLFTNFDEIYSFDGILRGKLNLKSDPNPLLLKTSKTYTNVNKD